MLIIGRSELTLKRYVMPEKRFVISYKHRDPVISTESLLRNVLLCI